ncbi:MAG: hypothetical protein KAS23_15120 [Anaerohalosphaera sp.]|nr:hypothetical protein [Anaerohalosphaera sp.]
MSSLRKILLAVIIVLSSAPAWALNNASVGYLYPAGGQRGQTIRVVAGGQFLRGTRQVYVSGEGVTATVIKQMKQFTNLQRDQRTLVTQRFQEVMQKRIDELPVSMRPKAGNKNRIAKKDVQPNPSDQKVKMPQHPLLEDLESKSLRELAHARSVFFIPRNKLQPNRQLAEMVLLEITIAPDAKPGNRELRLITATGLTGPIVFQVGMIGEVRELEPNNNKAYPPLPGLPNLPLPKAINLPVVLNGQILPGDVDRFRFRARKGQNLVIDAQARSLIPYLADAVPGWFQATITLYNSRGQQVAFAEDYHFNPDPVMFYKIEHSGEYEIEIHDSIYRGRDDFVYRISIGELPFITQMFPLGGQEGKKTVAMIGGLNLPADKLELDMQSKGPTIRKTSYLDKNMFSNELPYAVGSLPERIEVEGNNNISNAQNMKISTIMNGRIGEPGDIDIFKISGRKGEKIVAEIYARRLNSPMDSLLRLTDTSGKVLQWNDDYTVKDHHLHKDVAGLVTHHADSYMIVELPATGTYYIHVADSQDHGGDAFSYRLRVSPIQPDFDLRVTPSSLAMPGGSIQPLMVYVLRKDGFEGEIKVGLKNAPEGFKIDGGMIPAGSDNVRMTLRTPLTSSGKPIALVFTGSADVGGKTIARTAMPADNVMQAFLYRHLVPTNEFLVSITNRKWKMPVLKLSGAGYVDLPIGGSTKVKLRDATKKPFAIKGIILQLHNPPEGLTLNGVQVKNGSVEFELKADKEIMKNDFVGNLIVEVFREYLPKSKDGKVSNQKRRNSLGFIPAIPVRVTAPKGQETLSAKAAG